jgi:hypothetical protein
MSFQNTVMIIAIVLLVVALLFIAVILYNAKSNTQYPPEIGSCPDYWKLNKTTGECENVKGLGSCQGNKSFAGPEWEGAGGLVKKYKWANSYGLVWQGVTNNSAFN